MISLVLDDSTGAARPIEFRKSADTALNFPPPPAHRGTTEPASFTSTFAIDE
jgi:hypothetical protein